MQEFAIFFLLFSFFFGSIVGSFLNVVILRLPNEEPLSGRSHCLVCKHQLSVLDLFPLFSFLFLAGKCRYCGVKISPRYFIIEFITGLLFSFCWLLVSPTDIPGYILLIKYFLAVSALIVVFVVDFEHYIILDSVIFWSTVLVSALNLILDLNTHTTLFSLQGNFFGGAAAAILGVLPFFILWFGSKGKWMGFGDVKLAILLGVLLGFPNIFVGLMLAVLLGGLVSSILLAFSDKTLKSRLPFGTFLSIGTVLAMFYGDKLLSWYLSFLGF